MSRFNEGQRAGYVFGEVVKSQVRSRASFGANFRDRHFTVGGAFVRASWFERQEAERVAWEAPGVSKVENQISIAA